MRIADWYKPRRAARMLAVLKDDYISFDSIEHIPEASVYLVPTAWWYKKKFKPHVEALGGVPVVMVDYGREFEEKHKNATGIKPVAVAMMDNSTPNDVPVFPFSTPSFDPYPEIKKFPLAEQDKEIALVTMERPKGKIVTSLIKYLVKHDYFIIWKMRNKWLKRHDYYRKCLEGTDHIVISPDYKDYNDECSIVEQCANICDIHINIEILSLANQEMVRHDKPTYIWTGRGLVTHKRIELTKKYYGGKPRDYCTQNLIRNIRENINNSR